MKQATRETRIGWYKKTIERAQRKEPRILIEYDRGQSNITICACRLKVTADHVVINDCFKIPIDNIDLLKEAD